MHSFRGANDHGL